MDPIHALVLGVVQGVAEFLPISSSGHLALTQWVFGWDDFADNEQLGQAFDVSVHVGTLVAVVIYFRADLVRFLRAGLGDPIGRRPLSTDGRTAWLLLLSALPAAVVGLVISDSVAETGDDPLLVGVMLIVFGAVMSWADGRNGTRSEPQWTPRHALGMGIAQAVALQPGVSRSGVTMTTALALGYQRADAARLAFLMSIPVIAGAALLEGAKVVGDGGLPPGYSGAFAIGFCASAVTGWLAIWVTLRIVQTHSFRPFVLYRYAVGSAVIVAALVGYR